MSVRINFELGHEAALRTKRTQEGFTHDWEVFVRGCDGADIQHYVEKVVFYLHETFSKPKRVIKDPPFSIKESGYAGFVIDIDIYLRNKDEPKKIRFNYDLSLQNTGPPIHRAQKEKYIFKDPNDEFKQRLLKGGGQIVNASSIESESKSNSEKNQLLNKPKLGGSIDHKKIKKPEGPRETTFKDLFGPPIKCTKTPEPKPPSGSLKEPVKKDKDKDKLSDKDRKNKSPIKDRDKEKRDKKDKSKERSKDHDRSSKDKKRDKSPRRSVSPGSRRGNSPKRISSPKRPQSPTESKSKDDRKDDKDKRKEKEKDDSKKYKKRDKDKEKEYKEHREKDKDFKKEIKVPSISMTMKEKEPSPLPPPPPTIKIEKKEKPKDVKPDVRPEPVDVDKAKSLEEKKDKHKHKKKDKDRDKEKDKEKRDKNAHKSKEKKYEPPGNNLFSSATCPPNPAPNLGLCQNQNQNQVQNQSAKHDKKKFAVDAENDNSNSSCSSTKDSEEYKPPSPAPTAQPPAPSLPPEPKPDTKPKKDKTKKKDKKLDKEEKRRRRRDLSPCDDEPMSKTPKEGSDGTSPPAIDVDSRSEENPEDYLRILQDLQHKIMSLQDNTELQKVVKLIAETGRYEVSARTFDFDLCLLERSTVRRLQEFFSVSS